MTKPPTPARPVPAASAAARADDLGAIRDAVVDAAGVSAGLWLSYLFALFYVLVAAGGVTHRDLLLFNTIKLPFLSIDLPLQGFSVLGPTIFIVVHAYVLLHFALLAAKVGLFEGALRRQVGEEGARTQLRRQLPINIFVQFLAGPDEVRRGSMRLLLHAIAWISLFMGPVATLVLFVLQFLPLNSVAVTWAQRGLVGADLLLLWVLWPKVIGRTGAWTLPPVAGSMMVLVTLGAAVAVLGVATFPGDGLQARLVPAWLHGPLAGNEDGRAAGAADSPWSDHLVLTGVDVGAGPPPSLQWRRLDHARLNESVLRRVNLLGASLRGADLDFAQLGGAILNGASLQGARLTGAKLGGASLERAQLAGARLDSAQLPGANLREADLDGANLAHAQLQGADLTGASLRGALLAGARLQGARLDGARLDGATLDDADLQGATLAGAQLDAASMLRVRVWRADPPGEGAVAGARVAPLTGRPPACGAGADCEGGATLPALIDVVERGVEDPDNRAKVLARLRARLDPQRSVEGEGRAADAWAALAAPAPR